MHSKMIAPAFSAPHVVVLHSRIRHHLAQPIAMRSFAMLSMATAALLSSDSAQAASFSYIAGLRTSKDGQNYCTGVLISKQYVLTTTTECDKSESKDPTYVTIGSSFNRGSDGETFQVTG